MLRTFLFSVLLTGAAWCQAQQPWALERCIQYARDNNLQIRQANAQAESSEVDVRQSRAALFPTLTFNTSQRWGFQQVNTQTYSSFDAHPTNPTYTGSYNLSATVTLFDGGANWRTLRQNQLTHQGDQLSAQQTANNVELQIIRAYYQLLYAHEAVLTAQATVEVAQRELERAQARLEVGKVSKVDVAQMQSQLLQNEYQQVNAMNQEAQDLLQLKQLLQLAPDAPFSVEYVAFSDADVLELLPPLVEAEQMALAHLPDMQAAELDVQAARMSHKVAKGGYYPTLSASAGVSTSNGNNLTGNFTEQVRDHLQETLGLSLSLPIIDGRRVRSQVDKAKLRVVNAIIAQEDTRLQLQNTIATLHLDTQSAQARYRSAVANEEAARLSLELMEQRYDVGLESLIDLLARKNAFLQARQETLQNKFTALLDLRLMKFYTGQETNEN